MFETEWDIIMYISKRFTDGGFDKNSGSGNFTLNDGNGIFGTIYFVNVTLMPTINQLWSIQLGKTITTGYIFSSVNMGRTLMSMSDAKEEGFTKNIDDFIDSVFDNKEIKIMLRKKKLKKLKENVSIL